MKYHSTEAHAQYRFMVMMRESFRMEHFNNLFPLLADDCSLESSWLSVHKVGNTAVKTFLDDSLEDRWQRNIPWNYGVAEILEALEGSEGKGLFGFHILRDTEEAYNSILITAAMDDQGKAKQIWIEDANTYSLRVFLRCICVEEVQSDGSEPLDSFLLPDTYWDYLHFGLNRACKCQTSLRFLFTWDQFIKALYSWTTFLCADSYDIAFEILGDVNYLSGRCGCPEAARFLGDRGKRMWEAREKSGKIMEELDEWVTARSDHRTLLQLHLPKKEWFLSVTGGLK